MSGPPDDVGANPPITANPAAPAEVDVANRLPERSAGNSGDAVRGRTGGTEELADILAAIPIAKPRTCRACGTTFHGPQCGACLDRARDRALRKERFAALMKSIPERYRDVTFDNPERLACIKMRASLPDARRLAALDTLVVRGPSRIGKTTLGVALLRLRFEAGTPALLETASRLALARIQHPAGDGEPKIVEDAMRIPLLLLDDLGNEPRHAMSAVSDVIFARYNDVLPTWVTTGMTRGQIALRYGDGIAGRLFEAGERAAVIRLGDETGGNDI